MGHAVPKDRHDLPVSGNAWVQRDLGFFLEKHVLFQRNTTEFVQSNVLCNTRL